MQLQGLVTPSVATESQVKSDGPHWLPASQASKHRLYPVRALEPQIAATTVPPLPTSLPPVEVRSAHLFRLVEEADSFY